MFVCYLSLTTKNTLLVWMHLSLYSLQILSVIKSLRFRGWRLATRTLSSLRRFSMGLRSGDWLGHSRTLMCFFLSHSFVTLAVCFGSLSCWNTHPWPIFNALAGFNALALTVHGPVHRPFDAMQLSCPLSRKTPPKHNVFTSMFDSGDGVLGVIGSMSPPPNTASWVDAKELDFGLIWPQLSSSVSFTQFSSEQGRRIRGRDTRYVSLPISATTKLSLAIIFIKKCKYVFVMSDASERSYHWHIPKKLK